MNVNWRAELPQVLLIVGMFALAALTWSSAPERIPTHWNAAGEVDGWGGRFAGLLLLPLIAAATYLLMLFVPRLDPGRANYARFAGPYSVIRLSVTGLLAAVYLVTHLVIRGQEVSMDFVVALLAGLMFMAIGGVLGKVRPNWFVGVRTPWTLSSKMSWNRTHRFAGWLFLVSGLLTVIATLFDPRAGFAIMVAGALGGSLTACAYSYFVWRGDPDKIPPVGTMPADNGQ